MSGVCGTGCGARVWFGCSKILIQAPRGHGKSAPGARCARCALRARLRRGTRRGGGEGGRGASVGEASLSPQAKAEGLRTGEKFSRCLYT